MNKLILSSTLLITLCIPAAKGQGFDGFINNYKHAYHNVEQRRTSSDSSLVYISCIMNLYDGNDKGWLRLPIDSKRCFLLDAIDPPILANQYAIDPINGVSYFFPTGLLDYNNVEKKDMMVSQSFKFFHTRYVHFFKLLTDYFKYNCVQYVFTIANTNGIDTYELVWTIENNSLYVLTYDRENDCLVHVDAQSFLEGCPDEVFMQFWDYPLPEAAYEKSRSRHSCGTQVSGPIYIIEDMHYGGTTAEIRAWINHQESMKRYHLLNNESSLTDLNTLLRLTKKKRLFREYLGQDDYLPRAVG